MEAKWAMDDAVIGDIALGVIGVSQDGINLISSEALAISFLQSGQLDEYDSSGRRITKVAAAQKGATYVANFCEITTSQGIYSKKYDLSEGDYVVKFFDTNGNELSGDLSTCTETRVLFQPTIDYEIIAGKIHVPVIAPTDVRVWVLGGLFHPVTYLPIANATELVRNANLKHVQSNLISDGRASKYMAFSTEGAPYPTNKLLFIVRHGAGVQYSFSTSVENFR
jgi:hypothetical protein